MNLCGLRYVDDGKIEVQGNLPHLEFSDDVTPDLGPLAAPNPLDLTACEAFRRAEEARMAKDVPTDLRDLVDFRVILTFEKPVQGPLRLLGTKRR